MKDYTYPLYSRYLHVGLAVAGIAAYLTAESAGGGSATSSYLLHAYLGLSLAVFIMTRLLIGLAGPKDLRFASWSPFSARQWRMAVEDVSALLRFSLPRRDMHEGLAGLVQMFGLILFAWMAVTGTVIFITNTGAETELFEAVEELHEVGEALIPLYLVLHVGSVVMHSIAGHPVWQKMWTFRRSGGGRPSPPSAG